MTTIIRRTSSELASMSRAAQRRERLLQIEKEQRIEEAEALKMTEEQREILLRSFTSVKVEFSDLDGLKWTHSALRKRQGAPHPKSPGSPTLPNHTFVILTNADLASFSPEDTIRASAARPRPRFPSHSSPNLSKGPRAGSPVNLRSPVKSHFPGSSPKLPTRHKEGRRTSDIEVAASCHAAGYESDCDRTVRGGSDVESDLEYESSGGGVGSGKGRGKRMGKRAKRKIRTSMAGDDGMMNDDDDGVAWEDTKGETQISQAPTVGEEGSLATSTPTSGVRLTSLTSSPIESAVAPTTPSKAPAFITYSSPTPRTITSSSSAPSLPSPIASPTQPALQPTTPTSPKMPLKTPLLGVSHSPSTIAIPSSSSLPRLGPTPPLSQHMHIPGASSPQAYSCEAPLPLTRLPHRIRRAPPSPPSSISETQVSSPPLKSLPFPFPSLTPDPARPPLSAASASAPVSCSPTPLASSSLSPSSRPGMAPLSTPATLVVRGWNPPCEGESGRAEGVAVGPGLPAGATTDDSAEPGSPGY